MLFATCVSCLAFCGCAQKVEKVNAYRIDPNAHSAVTPVPGPDKWWESRHQAILERVKQGNIDMIFIGDSITQGWWDRGIEVWRQYYDKRNALNMGIDGDRTQYMLWRLDHGEITGISPKLAVLMIGTNNSNRNDNTAKEISEGIVAICQKLRKDLPNTKILLLGIFPRGDKPSPQREKNAEASRLASTIADGKWIYYMDFGDKFLEKDGTLPKDIMPDGLHPNSKGYQIEAEAIEPLVEKLMGARK
ncbi:MAG: hypothetical protein A2Y07_06365 [Planctomycetes bacterium GWF2_50_10]|nr:MAG: hypothetical protein A2Y07_06365 [Planctomycetes bacterium GWF2_50_10]